MFYMDARRYDPTHSPYYVGNCRSHDDLDNEYRLHLSSDNINDPVKVVVVKSTENLSPINELSHILFCNSSGDCFVAFDSLTPKGQQIARKRGYIEKKYNFNFSANTKAEAKEIFQQKIKDIPRVWTDAENERAKTICLEMMRNFAENEDYNRQIVFSGEAFSTSVIQAKYIFAGNCWCGAEQIGLHTGLRIGEARLKEGENYQPWIGRLVAVCRLIDMPVPRWITEEK